LANNCHQLRMLQLSGHMITDTGLAHLSTGCTKLVQLKLPRASKITSKGLCKIAISCPYLKQIEHDLQLSPEEQKLFKYVRNTW